MGRSNRLAPPLPSFANEMGVFGLANFVQQFPSYLNSELSALYGVMDLQDSHFVELMKLGFCKKGSLIAESPDTYYVNWLHSTGTLHSMEVFKTHMTELVLCLADIIGADFWKDKVARTFSNPCRVLVPCFAEQSVIEEETASAFVTVPISELVVEVSEQELSVGSTVDSLTFEQDTANAGIDVSPVSEINESGGSEISNSEASITKRVRARKRPHSRKNDLSQPDSAKRSRGDRARIVLNASKTPGRWFALNYDSNGRLLLSTTQKDQATAVRKR